MKAILILTVSLLTIASISAHQQRRSLSIGIFKVYSSHNCSGEVITFIPLGIGKSINCESIPSGNRRARSFKIVGDDSCVKNPDYYQESSGLCKAYNHSK